MTAEERQELLAIFDITIADIDRAKQWSWTVTYQTAAALGAILGLSHVVDAANTLWPLVGFSLLAFGAGSLGYAVLSRSFADLRGYRIRKDRCIALLTQVGQQLMQSTRAPKKGEVRNRPKRNLPFRGVIVGMTILVIGLLALTG